MKALVVEIDIWLLKFINHGLSNEFFDFMLPYWRNKVFWIPLYLLILVYLISKYKSKSWIPVIFILLTVVMADYTSSSIIKPLVGRLRPCQNPDLAAWLQTRIGCGGGYSFTSSHATNHFAMATIFTVFLRPLGRWLMPVAYVWAASIAFAQVYVGVHYPLDIAGGAILGTGIGLLVWQLFRYSQTIFPKLAIH